MEKVNFMKFLIYTNHLGRGTTNATAITIMTSDLANFLKNKGHEVLVVGNKNLIEEDVRFDYIYIGGGDILRAYKLTNIIKDFQPDIIYSFMRPQSLVLALSTIIKKFDACYVGSVHNTDNYLKYHKALYLPYRILVKHLLERLDYIACPSRAIVEDLKKTYFMKEEKLWDCFKTCVNYTTPHSLPSKRIISWDYILLPIQLLTPYNGLRHKVFEWFTEFPAVLFHFLLAWLFHVNTSLLYFYTMDETLPLA